MEYTPVLTKDILINLPKKEEDWNFYTPPTVRDKIAELKAKFPSKDIWVETVTRFNGEIIKDKVFLRIERHFDYDKKKDDKKVVIKDKGWKLLFNSWLFLQSEGHEVGDYWTTDVEMDFETIIKLQEKIKEAFEWAKEVDTNLDKFI
jgi:hypothetical protein